MNQQIDEAQLQQDMSEISQITQALTQANILAQTIQENINNVLLLKQITQTQEQLQALEGTQQINRTNWDEIQGYQTNLPYNSLITTFNTSLIEGIDSLYAQSNLQ